MLLIGIYAALASTAYQLFIPMYIVYEIHGTWSAGPNLTLGLLEIASLMALTISFRAPAFYRRFVGHTARDAPPAQ